jgi:hypothetical protein
MVSSDKHLNMMKRMIEDDEDEKDDDEDEDEDEDEDDRALVVN